MYVPFFVFRGKRVQLRPKSDGIGIQLVRSPLASLSIAVEKRERENKSEFVTAKDQVFSRTSKCV